MQAITIRSPRYPKYQINESIIKLVKNTTLAYLLNQSYKLQEREKPDIMSSNQFINKENSAMKQKHQV